MKKYLAAILVFALLLPVLAGCQSVFAARQAEQPTGPSENAPPAQTPTASSAAPALNRENVLEIALTDAGLTTQEIYDLDIELDRDKGILHYDVDFEKDGKDYDYEIHAETGEILRKEVPVAPTVTPETVPQSTVGPMLREEAVAIALAHAKLTETQVRDLDIERDDERGTPRYEVDFEAGGYEYEYEIHAVTGEIIYSHKERD